MGIARGGMSSSGESETQTGRAQVSCNSAWKGEVILKSLDAQLGRLTCFCKHGELKGC